MSCMPLHFERNVVTPLIPVRKLILFHTMAEMCSILIGTIANMYYVMIICEIKVEKDRHVKPIPHVKACDL